MPEPRRTSALTDLGLTVVAPTLILVGLSGEGRLGPTLALVAALLFPAGHAVWTLARARRVSPLAVVALASVLLTGGIGLLELPPAAFAVKEGLVPVVLGLLCVGSMWTRWPVLGVLLDEVLDRQAVAGALSERGSAQAWRRAQRAATWQLGAVFAGSGLASFALATAMVRAPSGTEAFADQLGRYTAVSAVALGILTAIPAVFVLRRVLTRLEEATGREVEGLLR